MGQLSFFSADIAVPQIADLGGLLAAHGQITAGLPGSRLSILLSDEGRAQALIAECSLRGIAAEVVVDDAGHYLMRTDRSVDLAGLARSWVLGAVKSVPDDLTVDPGFLRCWAIAAGRVDELGYLLGLDPHVSDTYEPLIAACARSGLAGSYIGVRGGGPAIRVVGHRRLSRLTDSIGTPPTGLPVDFYPTERPYTETD